MISVVHWSVWIAVLLAQVYAYPNYRSKIPNGYNVPNPCNTSAIWNGVGHQASQGSGPRNPFGLDFAANDHVWNETLCEKDSDGDGRTNCEELGDPHCTWTEGSTPELSANLSHPGICEPITSPACISKNSFLNCNPFDCPAIKGPNVKNYTARLTVTDVPPLETTYICQRFTLPSDGTYDMIAFEPILDKADIVHHMLLYGCTVDPVVPENVPFPCTMVAGGFTCLSLIGAWAPGMKGNCANSKLGFRIKPSGFKYAVIQVHWNNPSKISGLTDSSGMRIYYTSDLRPNEGEVLIVGQTAIVIPPGQPEVAVTGSCTPGCTNKFPSSIFLTNAYLHMHLLGIYGNIGLYRNGNLVTILFNTTHYVYNSPNLRVFDDPIEVKPGDEIRVNCVYDSTSKSTFTIFGESTSDEMCFGFFAYYVRMPSIVFCLQAKSATVCGLNGVDINPLV